MGRIKSLDIWGGLPESALSTTMDSQEAGRQGTTNPVHMGVPGPEHSLPGACCVDLGRQNCFCPAFLQHQQRLEMEPLGPACSSSRACHVVPGRWPGGAASAQRPLQCLQNLEPELPPMPRTRRLDRINWWAGYGLWSKGNPVKLNLEFQLTGA